MTQASISTTNRPPSPTPSALPPIPASPTFSYASTSNPLLSTYNLPLPPPPQNTHLHLSTADLEASQTAYTNLLSTAKAYRTSLASLSLSASNFGSALEECARLKEARSEDVNAGFGVGDRMGDSYTAASARGCTADSLLAASGVHQLIANHQQILSETVYRSFEVPLLHELDQWKRRMEEEESGYVKSAKALSREIRRMEKEGLKLHRARKRDVGVFREHLVNLTGKLDQLTGLSGGYSRGRLRECQEMSRGIVECGAGLVRAEVDIFEALARKGWSGGGLDELLEKGRDLFANETLDADGGAHGNHHGGKIFSILPQNHSILVGGDGGGGDHTPGIGPKHQRSDSLLVVDGMPYQSLAGAISGQGAGGDGNSIFSASETNMSTSGILNRPRGGNPHERMRSPIGERVKDPLEDWGKAKPEPEPELDAHEDKDREEDDVDVEGETEVGSAKTVTPYVTPHITPPRDLNSSAIVFDSETEPGDGIGRRVRERRWSVTDDGTVSD